MTFEEWWDKVNFGMAAKIANEDERLMARAAWNAALGDAVIDTLNHANNLAAEGLTEIAEVMLTRAEDIESLKA